MTKRRPQTLTRIYRDDLDEIKIKFPNVSSADFFHIAVKTNPFIQGEAALRDVFRKKR